MAISTLSLGRPEFLRAIATVLGWDPTTSNWSSAQQTQGNDIVAAAERRFYMAHDWGFLHIQTTLALVASTWQYTLPDGFGAIEGDFTYAVGLGFGPIKETNEGRIRALRAASSNTADPFLFAITALTTDQTDGQDNQVSFYPTPSAARTLTYRYKAMPGKVTSALPYPWGGLPHSETLKALIEEEAAHQMEDGASPARQQRSMQMLAMSIKYDNEHYAPSALGYNGDGEMALGGPLPAQCRTDHAATYSSVQY